MVNLKKTLRKAIFIAIAGAVTSLISWLNLIQVDVNQTIYVTIAIAILMSIQDVIKHRND